jgi:SAM-dependent methyltransferase
MARRAALEVVEGFYIGHVAFGLYRRGVLRSLSSFATPQEVALRFGYDAEALTAALDFLYRMTDLVTRNRRGEYRLAPQYHSYRALGFHLDKFLGAYGGPVVQLDESLRLPSHGRDLVDRRILAGAFGRAETGGLAPIAAILRDAGVHSLLDLGCGTSALLRALCCADRKFRGWAVDTDAAICAVASEKIAAAGLKDRIRVIRADIRRLANFLPRQERNQVGALFGRSILNEFCRARGRDAVKVLASLRRLFPNRPIFVADYYGKLTYGSPSPARYRHTLLQDLAQSLTAQGVPPPDLASWTKLYRAAGCEILKAYEGEANGIDWFLHVVQL